MKRWGIDLGGTKIECAVLVGGVPIIRRRVPTFADQGYQTVLSQIKILIESVSDEIDDKPKTIGFATPGVLDSETRLMKNCNTVALNGKPLNVDLEALLDANVKIANDANCFALAEAKLGSGQSFPDAEVVFGVILGTGVGGGLVVHGKIIEGIHGIAGEWGHNVLIENGTLCYCGKRGCVETVISGVALENYYQNRSGKFLQLQEIVKHAETGNDEFATATIERLLEYFGRAISTLINVIDPELIIIGGGVGNIGLLYSAGIEHVTKHLFNPVN